MKMIMSIVHSDDVNRLTDGLREHGFQSTIVSTTGGFLREGNATLLIGVEDAKIDEVLGIIKETCRTRQRYVSMIPPVEVGEAYMATPIEVQAGGAIVFVLDVTRFERY